MFDFLPAVEAVELKDAPLVQVVAQVKFNSQSMLTTQSGALKLQESLAEDYPRLLPAPPQATITAGPGNVTTQMIEQWRLTDLAGERSIVVGPDQLSVETAVYSTWPDLRARLVAALDVLADITAPRVRERIGLRYINQIPQVDGGDFTGRVAPALLGLTEQAGWRSHLAVSLGQIVARDGSTQLTVRYGRGQGIPGFVDDRFMVDIDLADEMPKVFDAKDIIDYFDDLNDCSLRCFFSTLAEPYRAELTGQGGGA